MTDSGCLRVVGGTAMTKAAMADEKIPQDTFLPLLDAPLDDLAKYLTGDTWEARKDYLNNMMADSLDNLFKQTEFFETKGLPKSELMAVSEECLVALHVKIGQLLDAWGVKEPADKHAAILFVLSASSKHRHALARWMPNGTTSPPEEHRLFEPASPLAVFKQLSLMMRPGLAECWRETAREARS